MHWRTRFRPRLGRLEDRTVPSVSASVAGGLLTVSGAATNAGDAIKIVQTANNTFDVFDGAVKVNASPLPASNVRLALTSANDIAQIDLGGFSLSGSVGANLGNGDNTLSVGHGTIGGYLNVYGGRGRDAVTLDGLAQGSLSVGRNVYIALDGGAVDSLHVTSGVAITGYLTTVYVN